MSHSYLVKKSMNKYGLAFHHLGLAVTTPEKASCFLKGLGYIIGECVYDEIQNVNLILCKAATMPDVELIYRANSPGPIDNILKDFPEIIYHLCYSCSSIETSLGKMRAENRVMQIAPPAPAILFLNKTVSFYRVVGFGIIEILEASQT